MKKKKIIIVILALVIALIITALIVNQVIDKYDKSSIEFENKVVNEINSTNEIQETEANVVENTSINQDTKEELIQEDTNANTKTETQENKNEKQTDIPSQEVQQLEVNNITYNVPFDEKWLD